MTCEELRADYLLFATGTVGEPESSEMREHLARGCKECTEALREAHALAYSMGALVNGPEPPRNLRGRVLAISKASPGRDSARRRFPLWLRPIAAWQGVALAMGCVVLALIPGLVWRREVSDARSRQAAASTLLAGEQRSEASLREQIAKLEGEGSLGVAPIFALELERGAGGSNEPIKQLVIPRGAAAIVLALPADLVRQASAAELRNGAGETILTVSPLPASDSDSTGLTIAARLLPAGRYSVVLRGERELARLPFEVRLR